MRKSINLLQAAATLYEKNIDRYSIIDISGIVPSNLIDLLMKRIIEGNLDKLLESINEILLEGYPPDQIMSQFWDKLWSIKDIHEVKRSRMAEKIAFCEQCLLEGGREDLQLKSLFTSCLTIMREKI